MKVKMLIDTGDSNGGGKISNLFVYSVYYESQCITHIPFSPSLGLEDSVRVTRQYGVDIVYEIQYRILGSQRDLHLFVDNFFM